MNKTAISILQEYLVQQRRALPLYTEELSDEPGHAFKCTVSFEDVKVSGYASTKKEAKQKSAQLALQKMGVIETVCQQFNGTVTSFNNNNNNDSEVMPSIFVGKCLPNENYIGKLNELASTSGKPYACYQESIVPINGRFCVKCEFLKWKTEGYGSTKKSAKQDAARAMLELVRDTDIAIIATPNDVPLNSDKLENINKLNDAMVKKYKELTCEESFVPKSQTFPPMPHLRTVEGQVPKKTLPRNELPPQIKLSIDAESGFIFIFSDVNLLRTAKITVCLMNVHKLHQEYKY